MKVISKEPGVRISFRVLQNQPGFYGIDFAEII